MNDFTKEELMYIGDALLYSMAIDLRKDACMAIRGKVLEMIADYCDHENLKDVGKDYKVCRSCGEEIHE